MPAELVVCYVHQQVSTHSMALSSLPMPPCATCNITRRPRCGRRAPSVPRPSISDDLRGDPLCTTPRVLNAVDCFTVLSLLAYVNSRTKLASLELERRVGGRHRLRIAC